MKADPQTAGVAAGASLLSLLALGWVWSHHQLLLYGDAVAHLHIARRILDSRSPGFSQIGSVWLPLPHWILLPFVQIDAWWRTGFAGCIPSMLSFVAAVCGLHRLALRILPAPLALLAVAAFATNAGLLYLQTTAMTEPLFLALFLWSVVWLADAVEFLGADSIRAQGPEQGRAALIKAGLTLAAAELTRYDGWILAAAAGCWLLAVRGRMLIRSRAGVRGAAIGFALAVFSAPLWWLGYNAHVYHDPLDFLRGPYSAHAIALRTTPSGASPYPGYHDVWVAALYYLHAAQGNIAAGHWGEWILWLAAAGALGTLVKAANAAKLTTLLLWIPLPFYIYSVAYGSVPIFVPDWWPFSFYNTRYGLEMLPVAALFPFVLLSLLWNYLPDRRSVAPPALNQLKLWIVPLLTLLIAGNAVTLLLAGPPVFREAVANSRNRIPFERKLAAALEQLPAGSSLLMYTSQNIGALQQSGIPLRQTINESTHNGWQQGLERPAASAQFVLAIQGDPVSEAVQQHAAGLVAIATIESEGEPSAILYRSTLF